MTAALTAKCNFRQAGPGRVVCDHCGRELPTSSPPHQVHAVCRGNRPATSNQQPATNRRPCCGDAPISIGIVIPTYNCGPYLERCLASLRAQTLKPAKVVIVDDGSTDDTQQVLAGLGLVAAAAEPGLLARARNYLTARSKRLMGAKSQPEEITAARMAICQACPSRDPDTEQCRECGCWLPAKVAWPTETCPRGFWGSGFPVEIISHEINRGANAARQTGIDRLDTTWILLADADAEYDPTYLERLAETARHTPAADLVYCSLTRQREGSEQIEQIWTHPWRPDLLWWTNYISMGTLIRRQAFLEVIGQLPTHAVHLDGLDDWALWLKFAAAGRTGAHVDTPLIHAWERAQGKTAKLRADPTALRREIAHHRRQHAQLIGCREPISIVIPYFNCSDLLQTCLEHIRDYCGLPYEILIVDNGSAEPIPDVAGVDPIVIRNARNLGFTKACNQGFRVSQNRHVLLLNSDCFIGPDCVEKLYHHLQSGERIAAVGPRTNDGGHQSITPGQRETLSALAGARRCAGPPRAIPQRMLAFFCTLISRDAIQAIGPQDSRPVFESGLGADDEWCHRANQAGWRCLLADDAFAQHLGSQSFRRNNIDRDALQRPAIAEILRLTASS